MYALVDCNNFYASCERVFNPALRNKPVIIWSNNDGNVISRSNEAKALGIPMGATAFEYKQLFKENNVYEFSSNYELYGDMSSRVMNLLSEYTPEIDIYSIDEAFLNFKGFELFDLNKYCKEIIYKVTKGTGIPICIGVAPTKSLSKVANKIAKKFQTKTGGVYIIDSDEKRIKALKWLPIDDVWGIGRQFANKLKQIGVDNAYKFTQLPDEWVKKNMAIVGYRLKRDLEGIETLELEEIKNKKSIATTRSFDKSYSSKSVIKERVSTFAVNCAEKLRKQNSNCNSIIVFIQTNGFRKNEPQYSKSIVVNTDYPTNSSIDIVKFATHGLDLIFKEGYSYKKAGVILMNITPNDQSQLNLFVSENPKHKKLMSVIDNVNTIFGKNHIVLGCQDTGRVKKTTTKKSGKKEAPIKKKEVPRVLRMKQEKLSPRYTTKIEEIIQIR